MWRRKPPGLWQYDARGSIWKIVPGSEGLLVGESRDTGAKTASFFCVSLDDGSVRWEGVTFSGGWWTGIEGVHRGVVMVHEYPDPGMPDHRKIFAVDLRTGATLWENGELAFAFARGGSVYASKDRFDRRDFFRLDLATGEVLETVAADRIASLRAIEESWEMEIQTPFPAGPSEAGGAAPPRTVVGEMAPGAMIEAGEMLTYGEMVIANWYEVMVSEAGSRRLREHLFALRGGSGEAVFHDVVCDDLSNPAGAAFFRAGERLVYVKQRTVLRSFRLVPEHRA